MDKTIMMNKTVTSIFLATAMNAAVHASDARVNSPGDNLRLWYDKPASNWTEALPLGNGRLGAMVFGGESTERLQLNEESLWAGCPVEAWPKDYFKHLQEVRRLVFAGKNAEAQDYGLKHLTAKPTAFRSYEPLADLRLEFGMQTNISNYRRELDLAEGVARVTWRNGGATLTREAFISAPDDVLAVRVASDKPGTLTFDISLARERNAEVQAAGTNQLHLDGQIIDVEQKDGGYEDNPGGSGPGGAHMKFAGRLVARVTGGTVKANGGQLCVRGATKAVILFTAATDYSLAKLNFDRRLDPAKIAEQILKEATTKSWHELLAAHLKEHRAKFGRVSVELPPRSPARESLPTDARLEALKGGGDDAGLVAMHFQYGRYLLMSSSRRPGRLPANLQGIWNDRMWAPWESDYHLNINLQMNYWPARAANLAETAEPLMDWFELLARRGRETARRLYEADGWAVFLASNPFGRVTPSGSTIDSQFLNSCLDPLCGAWMSAELFDLYQFTGDRAFLKRLYPVLKGASEYVLDTLFAAPDGTLVVVPSTSPENSYIDPQTKRKLRITIASTYHMSIVRAIFDATDRAAAILGIDDAMRRRIAVARGKLPPLKLGSDGRILEWAGPYQEAEPGHRHMSHLIGLHPFDLITRQTPKLFAGARKSLDFRLAHGGSGTGWSRAWTISFLARLQDGDEAYHHYLELLGRSTLPNLLDNCPPFQIDGNFGGTTGFCEMLLQSHERVAGSGAADQKFIIHLLPALPKAWSRGAGSVKGLCARGGFTVDMVWKEGRLNSATVHSTQDGECQVRSNEKVIRLKTKRGGTYPLKF